MKGKVKAPNMAARIVLVLFVLSVIPFLGHFADHFIAHFTGSVRGPVITGQWHVVVLNVLAFCAFLVPLTFRRKANWKERGLVIAFFVSLFVEMYGIPFIILFASRYIGGGQEAHLRSVFSLDLLGTTFAFTVPMIYGSLLIVAGTAIVALGWVTLYRGVRKEALVTGGVYAFSRHPQYLGFIMVIAGWMVGWTTALTLVFGSVLIVMYIRVCLKEESEMARSSDYGEYMARVPFML